MKDEENVFDVIDEKSGCSIGEKLNQKEINLIVEGLKKSKQDERERIIKILQRKATYTRRNKQLWYEVLIEELKKLKGDKK